MVNREISVDVLNSEMIVGTTKDYLTKTYSAEMDAIAPNGWALHFKEMPIGYYSVEIHLKDILLYDKVKFMIEQINNTEGVVNVTKIYGPFDLV